MMILLAVARRRSSVSDRRPPVISTFWGALVGRRWCWVGLRRRLSALAPMLLPPGLMRLQLSVLQFVRWPR